MSRRWWLVTLGAVAVVVVLVAVIGLVVEVRYDPSLQEWSYIATAFAALVTTGLVAALAPQLWAIGQQLRLDRSAVDAATKSAAAAERTVREARRARADEQAPRVVTWLDEPVWPPYIDATLREFPGEEIFASAVEARWVQVDPSREFVFPQDETELLWFLTWGMLINEGRGTARVRLDGSVRFRSPRSLPGRMAERVIVPRILSGARTFLLGPGDIVGFEWAAGHPLREWADKYKADTPALSTMHVYSSDFTEHMVQDVTKVEFSARPLEPLPHRDGGWRLVSREPGDQLAGAVIYPTERRYRSEETDTAR